MKPALLQTAPRFSLTDVFGRLVLEQVLPDFSAQVDVRHLPSGVYFWQYWFGRQAVQSGKVVKHHPPPPDTGRHGAGGAASGGGVVGGGGGVIVP